jgi:hypothetical protein
MGVDRSLRGPLGLPTWFWAGFAAACLVWKVLPVAFQLAVTGTTSATAGWLVLDAGVLFLSGGVAVLAARAFSLRSSLSRQSIFANVAAALLLTLVDAAFFKLRLYLRTGRSEPLMEIALGIGPSSLIVFMHLMAAAHAAAYYVERRERVLEDAALRTALLKSKVEFLRIRLPPGFLVGALHELAEVMRTDVAEADRYLARLGEVLRGSLRARPDSFIPLKRELDFARAYLYVERLRSGTVVKVRVKAGDGARRAHVPAMLLKPLLEHSLAAGPPAHRRVVVSARVRAGGTLEIRFADRCPPPGGAAAAMRVRDELRRLYGDRAAIRCTATDRAVVTSILVPPRASSGESPRRAEHLPRPSGTAAGTDGP